MGEYALENYTYQDYLDIDKTTPQSERYELIFGHIFCMSGASAPHQDVVGNIFFKLKGVQKKSSCLTRIAPFDIKIIIGTSVNVVQPDIMLYCKEEEIPCAIFEVLSPSTAYKDKGVKKELYELFGVREYFLVDPLAFTIDKFILKDNKYHYDRCYGDEDMMRVECLDEELSLKEMFE